MIKSAHLLFALAGLHVAALAQFVPATFPVPAPHVGKDYKLRPLGPDIAEIDFKAYMSSIEHIRAATGGDWPRPGLTMQDQARDMAAEQEQWKTRASFPYAALTLDGSKELGCFYIRPSGKAGYDAVATMWVTKEQFDKGFEQQLFRDMKAWLAKSWKFQHVAWVGHEITPAEWKALPDRTPRGSR